MDDKILKFNKILKFISHQVRGCSTVLARNMKKRVPRRSWS